MQFKTNKVIVKDSRENEWLYICLDGECRVLKCMSTDRQSQDRQLLDYQNKQMDYALTADFLHNQRKKSLKSDGKKSGGELFKS